jgi:hypothetical protein
VTAGLTRHNPPPGIMCLRFPARVAPTRLLVNSCWRDAPLWVEAESCAEPAHSSARLVRGPSLPSIVTGDWTVEIAGGRADPRPQRVLGYVLV